MLKWWTIFAINCCKKVMFGDAQFHNDTVNKMISFARDACICYLVLPIVQRSGIGDEFVDSWIVVI